MKLSERGKIIQFIEVRGGTPADPIKDHEEDVTAEVRELEHTIVVLRNLSDGFVEVKEDLQKLARDRATEIRKLDAVVEGAKEALYLDDWEWLRLALADLETQHEQMENTSARSNSG